MVTQSIPSITLNQAAASLNKSWKTVWRWAITGKLKTVMVGGTYRTTEEWILACVTPVACEQSPQQGEKNGKRSSNKQIYAELYARHGIKKVSD